MPLGHITLTKDSPYADYNAVAHQESGTVFKIVDDDYEQVMLNLQNWFPQFEAIYVHPGTDLYTIEGSGTMIVVTPQPK